MKLRVACTLVYLVTAVFLGHLGMEMDTDAEIYSMPVPLFVWAVIASCILFAFATITMMYNARVGIISGFVGAAPWSILVLGSILLYGWPDHSVEGSAVVIMLLASAILSVIAFRRTRKPQSAPSTI